MWTFRGSLPIPGVASMGGAQDGRTIWYEIGAREGLRSSASGDHGRKAVGIDAAGDPLRIAQAVANPDTAPKRVPLRNKYNCWVCYRGIRFAI